MKVGFKTSSEFKFNSIELSSDNSSPILVSLAQHKDNNMNNKFLVWHIEGGLGKNVAATALISALAKKYSDRKLVVVASYPEIFLNHPDVYRVYRLGMTAYFYEDYILGKDTLVFRHEPYFQTGHIMKQKHLIENWADLLGIKVETPFKPDLRHNMIQQNLIGGWQRSRPICLIQTNGGILQNNGYSYLWTRDMPIELAIQIANLYSTTHHIIQVTKPNSVKIPGVEVVDTPITASELFALVAASDKRILIDSCLQHAAAAYNLPSTVLWIGTSPQNFGYDLHTNIKALPPSGNTKLIDSYLFDYSFEGVLHECPYTDINEMFNIEELNTALQ
jgi:hypothetical protein